MASTTDDAIVESMLKDIEERARRDGVRSLLGDRELTGVTATGAINMIPANSDAQAMFYDTLTGEPRVAPAIFLGKTLRKTRGGKKAFVAADPQTGAPLGDVPEYRMGTHMCFLHPDHPDRAELEEMGIGPDVICGSGETTPAAHIPSEFQLRMHESHKHPQSFQMREEYRARKERELDREERRRNTEAMLAMAQQASGGTRQKAG